MSDRNLSADEEWAHYKSNYNKSYDAEEDAHRKKIYFDNKKFVKEHNEKYKKGEVSFSVGINQFSDKLSGEVH